MEPAELRRYRALDQTTHGDGGRGVFKRDWTSSTAHTSRTNRFSCGSGGKTFKVHLDGYDQRDLLAGKGPDKRREFLYWTDDGYLAGRRYDQYKAVFMEQQARGLEVWMQPLTPLRAPKLFNLRSDPFERAEQEAGDYVRRFIDHVFLLVPAQAIVAQHIQSFREFPPRQRPGSTSRSTRQCKC